MKRLVLIAAAAATVAGCADKGGNEVREELQAMIFSCRPYDIDSTEKLLNEVRYAKFDFVSNGLSYADKVDGKFEPVDLSRDDMALLNFKAELDDSRVSLRGSHMIDKIEMTFFVDRFTGRMGLEIINDENPAMNETNYIGECELAKEVRAKNKAKF